MVGYAILVVSSYLSITPAIHRCLTRPCPGFDSSEDERQECLSPQLSHLDPLSPERPFNTSATSLTTSLGLTGLALTVLRWRTSRCLKSAIKNTPQRQHSAQLPSSNPLSLLPPINVLVTWCPFLTLWNIYSACDGVTVSSVAFPLVFWW